MKYYIIAGEASGDLHGGNLITAIRHKDDNADIRCWGGDKMQAAGATLVKHYRDLAFMGFAEVVANLRTILGNIRFCKKDILQYNPDVLVLIDYPGFNLRIAEWAKKQNIKVVYYIAPQVWAWKEGRVPKMKRCIDKMMVILPFEKDYFKDRWGWKVDYVGHPLIEEISKYESLPKTNISSKPIIGLLPGSRKQEIAKKLPIMLQMAAKFADYQFVIGQAPGLDASFYQSFIVSYPNVQLLQNRTYDIMRQGKAMLVTSGTATLETALFAAPEIVCYKGSKISYEIAKRLIKVKFISLVNLIMDREVVKELIQDQLNVTNIERELKLLLENTEKKKKLQEDYKQLYDKLYLGGNASEKAANIIYDFVQN
ncbi:MAG: lipid-A-disaccharide synthase [Pseudopedobacter saltans]|uniref:Lipid-A-disaccharide synthase n=1 Tax=Pseudopedobacter saltans TaxID=151895 RepID=A0A2W5GTE2_9SPHI|nr:MAG: lipid-A-disaccharide synthase [Pseudopedobacter saltans]